MNFLKTFLGFNDKNDKLGEMLAKGAVIIDVRSPNEFNEGHVKNALNIPLQDFENRMEELMAIEKPIILCCKSGARSGQALSILKKKRSDCANGGSWIQLQHLQP